MSLVEAIDALPLPTRPIDKPMRYLGGNSQDGAEAGSFVGADCFKGQGGVTLVGRVEAGILSKGSKVLALPSNCIVSIKGAMCRSTSA